MYKGKRIAVVVPTFNEEKFIGQTLGTVPVFVDRVYAVNDGSTDRTLEIMSAFSREDGRVTVVNRERRGGVGAAIVSGHKQALKDGIDVMAVLAGDGQMDPLILDRMLDPVVTGQADYAKGNRFLVSSHKEGMPRFRVFGSFVLTFLTKIASGYWDISDPQNGYTAISSKVVRRIDLDKLYTGFAFENDLLVKLNIANARVVDVPVTAKGRYSGQRSKIRYINFIISTSWLLFRDFILRLWLKYIKRQGGASSASVSSNS